MTDTQPRPDRTLVPFPAQAAAEMEAAEQHGHTAVVGLLSALFAGVVMLARSVKKSPKVAQARAVVGYRLRKAPHDGAREDVPDFVDFRRRSGDHQAALLV
jgi:hypothetical protein